jgi:hypothetical protein
MFTILVNGNKVTGKRMIYVTFLEIHKTVLHAISVSSGHVCSSQEILKCFPVWLFKLNDHQGGANFDPRGTIKRTTS